MSANTGSVTARQAEAQQTRGKVAPPVESIDNVGIKRIMRLPRSDDMIDLTLKNAYNLEGEQPGLMSLLGKKSIISSRAVCF